MLYCILLPKKKGKMLYCISPQNSIGPNIFFSWEKEEEVVLPVAIVTSTVVCMVNSLN